MIAAHKILQITDMHLFESVEKMMFGVKTNEKFLQTLEFIENNNIEFDYIFLTGDLSQDETIASYKIIAENLSRFKKEIYWISGNHDDPEKMQEVFSQYPLFKHVHHLSFGKLNWDFIFVDTVLRGKDCGYLSKQELTQFSKTLNSIDDSNCVAVVMHHHPIPVNTPLIDTFILENSDVFFETINESKRGIDLIICGHVHGNYDIPKDKMRLISSPATCLQWKKGTTQLAIDNTSGFTVWIFQNDGKFIYETFFI